MQSSIHAWLLKATPAPLPVVSTPSTVRRRKRIIHDSDDEEVVVVVPSITQAARVAAVGATATKTEYPHQSIFPKVALAPANSTAARDADVAATATSPESPYPSGLPVVVLDLDIKKAAGDADVAATEAITESPFPLDMPVLISDSESSDVDAVDVAANITESPLPPYMALLICEESLDDDAIDLAAPGIVLSEGSQSSKCKDGEDSGNCVQGRLMSGDGTIRSASGIDPCNLWKSVPRAPCQFLDMSAKHGSDDNDVDSLCNTEHSELTEGFVDPDDHFAVDPEHVEFMTNMLTITLQAIRRVQHLKQPVKLPSSSSSLQPTASSLHPQTQQPDAHAQAEPSSPPPIDHLQHQQLRRFFGATSDGVAPTLPPLAHIPPHPTVQATFAEFIARLYVAGDWEIADVHHALEKAGGSFNTWSTRPSQREKLFRCVLELLQTSEVRI